jgi:hypothetical protein
VYSTGCSRSRPKRASIGLWCDRVDSTLATELYVRRLDLVFETLGVVRWSLLGVLSNAGDAARFGQSGPQERLSKVPAIPSHKREAVWEGMIWPVSHAEHSRHDIAERFPHRFVSSQGPLGRLFEHRGSVRGFG